MTKGNQNNQSKHNQTTGQPNGTNILKRSLRIFIRTVLFLLKWLALPVFIIVLLLLLVLTFFPFNSLKDYALEDVAGFDPDSIKVGYLDFSIFSGLSIQGIEIAPPEGFTRPIFKIKNVKIEYSIWHLFSNEFHINTILLDSPKVNFETNEKTTNINAFLATLPQSSSTAEEKSEEPETKKEKSDFKIVIHNFNLRNFSAYANAGQQIVDFKYFNMSLKGFFSEIASHFDISLDIKGEGETANFHFVQKSEPQVDADFIVSMQTEISTANVLNPEVKIEHNLDIKSTSIKTKWQLEPVHINQKLSAKADMNKDEASLGVFSLSFNEDEIINLTAELKGLLEQKTASVTLNKFLISLDTFAPYLKAVQKDIDLGGNIELTDFKAFANIKKVLNNGLPEASGTLKFNNVWVDYKPIKARVEKINSAISFSSDPDLKKHENMVLSTDGNFSIDSIASEFGNLKKLDLNFDAKANGTDMRDAKVALDLNIADIRYADENIGETKLDLSFDTLASANLVDGIFSIEKLNLGIKDTILLALSFESEINLEENFVKHLDLHIKQKPLNFAKLLQIVPDKIKASLPKINITGNLATDITISNIAPFSLNVTDPLALPIKLASDTTIKDLSLHYPEQSLTLGNSEATFNLKGTPENIKLSANVLVSSLDKKDLELSVSSLKLPMEFSVKPDNLHGKIILDISKINSAQEATTINNLVVMVSPKISGDLLKQRISGIKNDVTIKCDDITYAKSDSIVLENPLIKTSLSYAAAKKKTRLDFSTTLESLMIPSQNLSVKDFSLDLLGKVEGSELPLEPNAKLEPDKLSISNKVKIGSISKKDVLYNDLKNTTLEIAARIHNLNNIELRTAAINVPDIGLKVYADGNIDGLKDGHNKFIDFKTTLPEYKLNARIENSDAHQLLEDLSISGNSGLTFELRSLPGKRARMKGSLFARNFNLQTSSQKTVTNYDKTTTTTETFIKVKNFNADVPFVQFLDLTNYSLVKSDIDVFKTQSRNILYETMRNYMQQQSNFQVDEILWKQKKNGVEKELKIDKISLDVMYSQNTFAINRMYVGLLGGGITGALQVHLASVYPAPLDVQVHFENQITGINLAYLTAKDKKQVSPDTEFSSLVKLNFGLADRFLEGNIDITRLSLAQLDELLIFLDPEGEDPKVQSNRDLINSWYFKLINPKVKLVSMWLNYGNLNMDINMDAWFFVGTILQSTLENNKIRRYDIVPILNTFLPKKDTKVAAKTTDNTKDN